MRSNDNFKLALKIALNQQELGWINYMFKIAFQITGNQLSLMKQFNSAEFI